MSVKIEVIKVDSAIMYKLSSTEETNSIKNIKTEEIQKEFISSLKDVVNYVEVDHEGKIVKEKLPLKKKVSPIDTLRAKIAEDRLRRSQANIFNR